MNYLEQHVLHGVLRNVPTVGSASPDAYKAAVIAKIDSTTEITGNIFGFHYTIKVGRDLVTVLAASVEFESADSIWALGLAANGQS